MATERIEFEGHDGARLAGRLDLPEGRPRAYALFAHCFTCSKDLNASRRIAAALAMRGFGVLRFDFTGLGSSGGDFANTSFSSNVEDLMRAAERMRETERPVSLLLGHSLGGAAALAAAPRLAEVRAVATIGAPADVAHVLHNLESDLATIEREGEAAVRLGGRSFTIRRSFVEDAREQRLTGTLRDLGRPLLILHAPTDAIVGVDAARRLYEAARHPKSFVSLDGATHLLDDPRDARFAGGLIAEWAGRYLIDELAEAEAPPLAAPQGGAAVRETGSGRFRLDVAAGRHRLAADEPGSVGGDDAGPSPYDFLAIALAACTAMTLRLYAKRKGWEIGQIEVSATHGKVHAEDCAACVERGLEGRVDRFERVIRTAGPVDEAARSKLVEIAAKCPVHRTLEARALVETRVEETG